MSETTNNPTSGAAVVAAPTQPGQPAPYKKVDLKSDRPTWCPGCGDFTVLDLYFRLCERRQIAREKITTVSGIGCSSRFPYFVQAHGVHFIHGRAVAFASGLSLSRPDLHVFVFSGDGDAYSIGGNHLEHAARKNIHMTLVVMDNNVYGLTKKQTSPTSPIGFKSKTDPTGAVDRPTNPMKKLIAAGATFVARTSHSNPQHVLQMMERAMDHRGFSVIECLSECVEFYPGAFDAANPRKGGQFTVIEEKKNDGTPEDEKRHDPSDEAAAYKLATLPFPGVFGVFYEVKQPAKNDREQQLIDATRAAVGNAPPLACLQKTFARLK
ncbi:MAG: pyruvate ferredoxin oxidoreductase [Verrucomicrobia bacterium]|nr:pyruvate ferredoxin oxidoreductase [Verrucomicrobiota bacterium]